MPKILKILTLPKGGKELRRVAQEVELQQLKTAKMRQLVANMIHTMLAKDGVGLAAPQIGERLRLVVLNTKEGALCMINPVLTRRSLIKELGEEGCLSIPGVYGDVKRHKNVNCKFTDLEGVEHIIEAKGFFARAIQHELDHLDGTLFIDKAIIKKNGAN